MTASGRRLSRDAIAHVMAVYATTETGWGQHDQHQPPAPPLTPWPLREEKDR
jgi:hypothetical protein